MNRISATILCLSLILPVGCNRGEPGGAGVADNGTTTRTTTTDTSGTGTTTVHSANDTTSTGTSATDTTHTVAKPAIGNSNDTFTLSMPLLSTGIKQGETKNITISISRGDNFDEDVTLNLQNLPKGVTVSPEKPMIAHGESEAVISVTAAPDAALGDFTIPVSGKPSGSGANSTNELSITVEEK